VTRASGTKGFWCKGGIVETGFWKVGYLRQTKTVQLIIAFKEQPSADKATAIDSEDYGWRP
jgi:hypothetical protein